MTTIPPSTPFGTAHAWGGQYFHPISGALFVPTFFHEFILPTIPERSILPMQPLNWQFGVRPDRPFEVFPHQHLRQQTPISIPRWPVLPARRPKYPTAFYLEQLQFWEDGPLPEAEEPVIEVQTPGLLNIWLASGVEALLLILAIVSAVLQVLFKAAAVLLFVGKKAWKSVLRERAWEFAAAVLVASQIVRILPRMQGILDSSGGGRWNPEPAPLYVIMVPNPNQLGRLFDDVRNSSQWLTTDSKSCGTFMMENFLELGTVQISSPQLGRGYSSRRRFLVGRFVFP